MATFLVPYGMTLYDLSVELYGDASHVLQIVTDNPDLVNIQAQNALVGATITYTDPNLSLTNYWKTNNIIINTGQSIPLKVGKAFASAAFAIHSFS
jgi:hypothetical protein